MQLILEANINRHRENLLISNKVAVIILNKYGNASFYNIIFMECYMPNKPL